MPLEELDRLVVEGGRGRGMDVVEVGGRGKRGERKTAESVPDVSDSALSSTESHGEGGQRQGE
jgi:hypothetical protein